MKKKILILLSTCLVLICATVFLVFGFYNHFIKNKGSEIVLENVKFQVNDSPNKGEESVIYFTTDDLLEGDGYQVNLKYSLNGTFVSNYAMQYKTYFEIEDTDGVSNAIDVYRFKDGSYHFVDTLANLNNTDNSTSVYTDFLGTTGSHIEKFLFVYSLGSTVDSTHSIKLKISTSSLMVTTTSDEFPYFYLSDMGGDDDAASTAETIFKQLPNNELIYGRTIVLMKDLVYTSQTDITFNNLVGIDLNGHKIDLKGGTLTLADANETNTPLYNSKLSLCDSVGGGELVNSTINIKYNNSVIDIKSELSNVTFSSGSKLTVTSISLDAFKLAANKKFDEISAIKHTVTNGSYTFDLFGDLKYYLSNDIVEVLNSGENTISVLSSRGEASLSFDSTNYTFTVSGIVNSDSVSITIPLYYGTVVDRINNVLMLFGSTTDSCQEYLLSYVPKNLNGSIYLPTYISIFNAYITWISYDETLISNTGRVLPDGYFNLDSWVSHRTNLGFVIDQSGEVLSGVIKDIDITILTPEERTNLLFDEINITFDNENSKSYSFDIVDMLKNKYDEDDLATLASTYFNITLTATEDAAMKTEFLNKLTVKLGLDHVTVTALQEAQFVKEEHDTTLQPLLAGVTALTQNGVPNEVVSLVYGVNYSFVDGIITKYKLFDINTGDAKVTLVDLTNSLRVPFDVYSEKMTSYTEESSVRIYNAYEYSFQLVSSFDGLSINYTVPNEYKDYVRIGTTSSGQKILTILKNNVPADTHTVTIVARVSDVESPIYLPFTCVGILHNESSATHAEFEDSKLYIELLNKYDTNHDTTLTDLEAKNSPYTTLTINGNNITSIKGLKYFSNLTEINFYNNKIVNIDDLAYLKHLTKINLNKNNISSIKALEYLDNLRELSLSNNQISSIEPIQYLTGLTKLDISNNSIADFRYITLLTSLTELRVYENKISGKYTIDIDTYGSNQAGMTEVIRSNQYYFNLLKFSDESLDLYIKNGSTKYNFNAGDYALEANVLSQIQPIYQTSDTIVLPTHISLNNTDYEITYFTDVYSDYIIIERDGLSLTNITLKQLPVDNKVIIYANTTELAGSYFYRPLEFYIRKGYSTENHYGEIEVTSGNWVLASKLVKDTTLLASLWIKYDTNIDGKITYEELNPSTGVEVDLDSLNITSLDGIQYFGNITSLNARSNLFEDLDGDGFADIKYIGYLQNLKTLKLSGQLFNFDELLNYTRLPESGVYTNYVDETVTLKNISNNNFTITLRHGLTNLENIYVNGSLKLNEYSQKTKLYHVYLNNETLGTFTGEDSNKVYYGIHKDSDSELWNPVKEEISRFLGSLATSAKFINYNDQILIKKSYDIYLYDDLIPTTFNLSSGTISANEYLFAGGSTGNKPSDTKYKRIYDAGVDGNELKGVDSSYIDKIHYSLSSYFNIDTSDDTNISIKYQRLTYKDYQAYLNMALNATSVSQGRRELTEVDNGLNYYMTLFMQYNNDYVFKSTTDSEADGKALNSIFGAVETMLFVMNSLSEELRTGSRGYNYTITLADGTVEVHSSLEIDSEVAVSYDVTEAKVAEYDGNFNSFGAYDTTLYFFIHGNFMPTATSAVDGLRFLPQIKKVYFRRDAVLGTGKDLINVEELFMVYSFLDIKNFDVVLPNLKILICAQGTGTNLSEETSLDSNPNNLKETYLVYLPNLVEFFFDGEGANGKGTMYEWSAFLAYAYIPFGQIYNYNDTTKTITTTKYYSTDANDEFVGGVVLDTDKVYYWFDASDQSYDNIHYAYYRDSNGSYVPLTHTYLVANISTIFANNGTVYTNIFKSQDGDSLRVDEQLFRHVKAESVKLNNFKLTDQATIYSNTYFNQVVLCEVYKNLREGTITHYYLKADSQDGDSRDFDPSFSDIVFETTVTAEYDELAPTVANLHVKLDGETFDGTTLSNTEYNDLKWDNTDYSDYFRQGLVVKLPTKFNDYKTGIDKIDEYRNFTITWYVSFYVYSENTSTTKSGIQRTQVQLNDSNGNFTNTGSYSNYFTYEKLNNVLKLTLNYSGYYLFEGLLELSNGTETYSYNTSYNKNYMIQDNTKLSDANRKEYSYMDQYFYMDRILGSVSLIYPISITSMTNSQIDGFMTTYSMNVNSMNNICKKTITPNYSNSTLTNPYKLKWFDTIIDRTFKFSVFLTYVTKNKGVTDNFEYTISTIDNDRALLNTYDLIVKNMLGIEANGTYLSPSAEQTTSNPAGKIYTYTDKSKGVGGKTAIKTFSGLRRMISDIFTLDGWETLNITKFWYEYAMALSYVPDRIPVKLTNIILSSTQGITYYGGIFQSNIVDAKLSYISQISGDNSDNNANIPVGDSLLDLNEYLTENSELKLKTLYCSELTEDSYVLLTKICKNGNIKSSKLTVYPALYNVSWGIITFYDYNNVLSILSNMNSENNSNTSKLEIKLFNNFDLVSTLTQMNTYYNSITVASQISTSTNTYYTMNGSVASNYTILTPNSTLADCSDFIPNGNLGKDLTFDVAIQYKNSKYGLRVFKTLTGNSNNDSGNQYNVKVAVFDPSSTNTKINNGIIEGKTANNYTYSYSDLIVYDTDEFDPHWIRYLLSLTRSSGSGVANISINGYNSTITAVTGYQYHNGNNFEYGMGNTDPRSSDGYTILFDTQLTSKDDTPEKQTYFLIINTKYYSFGYDGNSRGPRSFSYTTIDFKGFEKLPFTAVTVDFRQESYFLPKKIINSNGLVANPKINYFGIGINWTGNFVGFPYPLVIQDISGLTNSLTDGATVYLGHHIKIQQKYIKYDSVNGLQLNTTALGSTKNFNTTIKYSKMHTLQYNGDYDTSFNYMNMKQEIEKSIMNNNPVMFKNYYDLFIVRQNNMFSFCTGGLTNITMFTNNINHPFVNEDSILFEDSVYSYYLKNKSCQAIYFGSKYDSAKLISTLINMNSDRLRKLSNNNYISLLDNSSNGYVQVDDTVRYSLTEGATIKLPRYDSTGRIPLVYYAVTTYNPNDGNAAFIATAEKHQQGNYYNRMGSSNSDNDLFRFDEHQGYWEIYLAEGHKLYTQVNYQFAVYHDKQSYTKDILGITNKTLFNNRIDKSNFVNYFYVDVNYIPNIGHYVVKGDDPLNLPTALNILGKECTLSYSIESIYSSYFDTEDKGTYSIYSLNSNAKNVKNVKILCTFNTTKMYYGSRTVTNEEVVTTWEEGCTYKVYLTGGNVITITLQSDFDVYNNAHFTIKKVVTTTITEFYTDTYTGSFSFFVDISTGSKLAVSDNETVTSSDYYVEVLFNTSTNEHVAGSLVYDAEGNYIDGDYVDSLGTPKSGYEWRIVPANTIFESGLLLTDLFYSGSISVGKDAYTRHDVVSSENNNVAYFPKYVIVNYNGEFVYDNGNLIMYDNDKLTEAQTAVTSGTYQGENYHLAMIYTKEQIANIHYFSNTSNDGTGFRAQSTLNGLEIFPLTHVMLGYYKSNYSWAGENTRAFPGNTFKCFNDMKLEEFALIYKHTSIYISDWTFLFNSRDTLKNFMYGGIKTKHAETYGTTHDDFTFLLSFDYLESVVLYGLPGIQDTQSFKYFINMMYLKHNSNIVRYFYNENDEKFNEYNNLFTGISEDITTSSTILNEFDTTGLSNFTYKNEYELYIGSDDSYYSNVLNYDSSDSTTQYLLPSYINDGGTYYKIYYNSLSNFANIVVIDKDGNELSMLQYQDAYAAYVYSCLRAGNEVNDYEFASNYQIYVRFNNLINCLTDRVMISMRIECQSKMLSKTEILNIDNSSTVAKNNYIAGTGYPDAYYDDQPYIYTPYSYERYLSIYVDHTNSAYAN